MLCEDKLPESTGDKLIAWGDGFQLFLGELDWTLWGSFELRGSDSFECLYAAGEQSLDQDCRGCLLRIAAGECLRSAGGYSISLIFDDLLGEECIVLLSGELVYTGRVF